MHLRLTLLANDGLLLVVRVVRVAKLAVRPELKFEKLVTKTTLVAYSEMESSILS